MKKHKKYYIGVDLGGTKVLTALADSKGKILLSKRQQTEANKGRKRIIANIYKTINGVMENAEVYKKDIVCIGVGAPGPLNVNSGMIYENSNLSWKNVPLVKLLEEKVNIPVKLKNDANAAALGEKYFGAGRDVDNLIYITISTGIGGGIIIDNKILDGEIGNAGEIGHMTLNPHGPLCGCGNYGCFEALASGKAIARMGREAVIQNQSDIIENLCERDIKKIDAELVARAAHSGDEMAVEIYNRAGFYLGIGLANLINLFEPRMILLGGGVSNSLDLFREAMFKSLEKRVLNIPYEAVEICPAELGDDTGVKGALAVAMEEDWT